MKVVWDTCKKACKKRTSLYWLYKCEVQKRRYICSFICAADAREVANHMGNGWKVAKRNEKPQICP